MFCIDITPLLNLAYSVVLLLRRTGYIQLPRCKYLTETSCPPYCGLSVCSMVTFSRHFYSLFVVLLLLTRAWPLSLSLPHSLPPSFPLSLSLSLNLTIVVRLMIGKDYWTKVQKHVLLVMLPHPFHLIPAVVLNQGFGQTHICNLYQVRLQKVEYILSCGYSIALCD